MRHWQDPSFTRPIQLTNPVPMRTFMIDILLHGMDDETRMRLLPREQEMIKAW